MGIKARCALLFTYYNSTDQQTGTLNPQILYNWLKTMIYFTNLQENKIKVALY